MILWTSLAVAAQTRSADWRERIRELLAANQVEQALGVTEQWLASTPEDLEAVGWRARLLAWSNRWSEAEANYRRVLESAPNDVDILLGLADVLTWQKRAAEALEILDRACVLEPQRLDGHVRRGRVLHSLGRNRAARAAFRQVLDRDPSNREAKAGLDSLSEEARHEFFIGSDIDLFNFTSNAGAVTVGLRSRLHERWTTAASTTLYRRFGHDLARFSTDAGYRLNSSNALRAGFAVGRHQGIIPKGETFLEYSHAFRTISKRGPIRGIEALYRQHWLWYRQTRVLVSTPGAVFYLPRDWIWSVQVSAARSHFAGRSASWSPSGMTRLSFPLRRQVTGQVFYAVGTENFNQVDQIGRFSARTWGGGLRIRLAAGQELRGYVAYQNRSHDRTQTSFGLSYAIRF
jgi:tetratricopeptide (TPR) repeat protein